jgi:hypothetical protein
MSNADLVETLLHSEPATGLEIAWTSSELTLAEKARVISALHMRSRMTLEGTARMSGATQAEIQAILELATLDDDDLELVSKADPPETTWFLFASAETDTIEVGIDALKKVQGSDEHVLKAVYSAMLASSGPRQDDRISAISAKTFGHLAHKAKEYNALNPKARQFLGSLAQKRRGGELSLSEKQLKWLRDILLELVRSGVVKRDSEDGDQPQCDEVLNALGV